MMRSLL